MLQDPTPAAQSRFPLDKADRCVKCGLCLPHCPTYGLSQNEADSPRGRIALMQGLASEQLTASNKLQEHLDGCLGCRACESVCPADVPYGELVDAVRDELQKNVPSRGAGLRRLAPWLIRPGLRRGLQILLRTLQVTGLLATARALLPADSAPGRRLSFIPPVLPSPARRSYPASTMTRSLGRVQLFTGCVSELFDSRSLHDAILCLQYCGFDVELPKMQTCCGALHQHNGMAAQAQALFQQNLAAFSPAETSVVGTASGCTAMLAEYDIYNRDDARAGKLAGRVRDISEFILQHWPDELALRPLNARVVVQDPCTLRNVLGATTPVYELLGKVPQLQIEPLAGNGRCCGAAGNMMFSHPAQADALVEDKLMALKKARPDYLLTSNVGCGLHLRAALQRAGLTIEVLHPVSLLAQQLVEKH